MATCPRCNKHFREPEGERGEHGCPYCGYPPIANDTSQCPTCGYEGCGEIEKTLEGTDADGNRGVIVAWVKCPDCGEDLDDDCPF